MRSVCSHFGIRGYPTMYYGAAEAFARYAERDADGAPHDGLRRVVPKGGPTAESVMAWLDENAAQDMPGGKSGAALGVLTGERGGRSGESGGDAERAAGAGGGGEGAGSGAAATDANVRGGRAGPKADGEEVPSVAGVTLRSAMDAALLRATQLVISNGFGSLADASEGHDPAARLSLVSFVALLADAHPLAECRKSAAALQHELPRLWPEGGSADAEALAHFDICGADAAIEAARADALEAAGGARRSWGVCEGSTPSSRGYTVSACHLWHRCRTLSLLPLLLKSCSTRRTCRSRSGRPGYSCADRSSRLYPRASLALPCRADSPFPAVWLVAAVPLACVARRF